MARDRRRPSQPSDETPLIPPPLADGTPAPRDEPAVAPVAPVPPDNPAVRATIDRVAQQLVGGMDQLDTGVRQTLDSVRAKLAGTQKAADRQIKGVLMDVDTRLSAASRDLAAAGVPISYSPGERASELNDPAGAALIDRVSRTSQLGGDLGGGELPAVAPPVFGPQTRGVEGIAPTVPPLSMSPPPGTSPPPPAVPPAVPLSPPLFPPPPTPPPTSPPPPLVPPVLPPPIGGPPPPVPPVPPIDFPDPIFTPLPDPPPDCYWLWTGEIWTGYASPGHFAPVMASYPPYFGTFVGQWAPAVCSVPVPPPPPPVPPTSPPPPPPPPPGDPPLTECPPATRRNSDGECVGIGDGGGGDGGGGQCCPPQEITVVSPPVTVTYPPPPPPGPAPVVKVGTVKPADPTQRIDWNTLEACELVTTSTSPPPPPPAGGGTTSFLSYWFSPGVEAGVTAALRMPAALPAAAAAIRALIDLPEAAGSFWTQQIAGGAVADYLLQSPAAARGENWARTTTLMSSLALAGLAEANTHAPFTYLFQSDLYALQFLNPQFLPTQAEIDGLYLTGRITDDLWECWTKAVGNLPVPARKVRDSKRTIPGVSDVVALARRGVISVQSDYPQRMRELGVVDPGHAAEFYRLSEFIPPFTDIMRMMVRDSEDRQVVLKYDYDKGFEAKFGGQLAKWAEDQGINPDVARYLWRAHWELPSNTALYEMFHRLRPDRPEVQEWNRIFALEGENSAWFARTPRPPVVTMADVKYAIEVNDMSPAWVDPLLAVSYRPITPTDARRMFEIGDATADELYHRLRDSGYDDPSAARLVKYEDALRSRRIANQTGTLSARKVMTAYREGLIDDLEADRLLVPHFPDADVRRATITRANTERLLETRRVQVRAVVKQYVYGEIDGLGLDVQLGGIGIVGQERITIIQRANANRSGHLKEVRVQYVLDMLQRGITTVDQTADRLERLGYSAEDTSRMIALAGAVSTERQAARAIRASEKARAEARRQKSDALRDLDRLRADRERQVKALEAYLEDLKDRIGQAGGTVPQS